VRLAPVVLVALLALGGLKAAGLWVNIAGAEAAEAPKKNIAAVAPAADRLSTHLNERSAALDARAAELDTREKLLQAAEARIDAAAKALESEKQAIALTNAGRARLRDDELSALSSAYERMKPRDAARIFEILDDDILIPVASGMRTQALAGVLAEMSAERAKTLTIALANRESPAQPAPAVVSSIAPSSTGVKP
jgi:flagellar motility protein MotE (MotC chaperone)